MQDRGKLSLENVLDSTIWRLLFAAAGNQAFFKREVDIGQRDLMWRSGEAPTPRVTFLGCQQARIAEFSQDAPYHDGVRANMVRDIDRGPHSVRISGHMAKGVQCK